MTIVARVASLIFNRPLLAEPGAVEILISSLASRFDVEPTVDVDASRFVGKPAGPRDADGNLRPMYRIQNGVAIVSIIGELVNRGAWIGASSGLVSYEGLGAQLDALEADTSVRGIVLDIDSPGGEASGAQEAAARVRRLAAKKPVVAYINGRAASAAYSIASGATKIVTTPSGMLGSIGVIWLHLDRSEQAAKAGVKPTIFKKGAFKADGNPFGAIPADAAARINATLGTVYDLFVETVAAHRPMSAAAIRATEAGVFMGQKAVNVGLADKVGDLADAISLASGQMPLAVSPSITSAPASSSMAAPAVPPAAKWLSAEPALARIGAILTHDLAKDRQGFAQHLALKTSVTCDQAIAAMTISASQVDMYSAISIAGMIASNSTLGSAAARARVVEILRNPEAKGRERQALYVAFKTDFSVKESIAMLAAGNRDTAALASKGPDTATIYRKRNGYGARVDSSNPDEVYRARNGQGTRVNGLDADAIYRARNGHGGEASRAKGESAADIYARRAREAKGKK
jgi:signal peptide peptidase SppA